MSYTQRPTRPFGMAAHRAVLSGQYRGEEGQYALTGQRTGPTHPSTHADTWVSSPQVEYLLRASQDQCICGEPYASHLVTRGFRKGKLKKGVPDWHMTTAMASYPTGHRRQLAPLPGRPNRKQGSRQPSLMHRKPLPASINVRLNLDTGERTPDPIESMLASVGL